MVLISLLGCGALASAPQITARPGELSIAAAAPGGFAALATPLDPDGRAWRVTLSGSAPTQAGSITGSVLLTTDVPGEESLSIRIGGVVRRQ